MQNICETFSRKKKKNLRSFKQNVRSVSTNRFQLKLPWNWIFHARELSPARTRFIVNSRLTWFTFIHSHSMLLDWAFRPLNSIHHTPWWIEYEGETPSWQHPANSFAKNLRQQCGKLHWTSVGYRGLRGRNAIKEIRNSEQPLNSILRGEES